MLYILPMLEVEDDDAAEAWLIFVTAALNPLWLLNPTLGEC